VLAHTLRSEPPKVQLLDIHDITVELKDARRRSTSYAILDYQGWLVVTP
jgi:hypothetical protein